MKKFTLFIALALLAFNLQAQSFKFGHINTNELVMLTADADSAMVKLQAYQKELEEELVSMRNELQNKLNTYQQKNATWTATVKESKESELQELDQRTQQFQQTAAQDLQQLQASLFAPIFEKAKNAIAKIAKEKGLSVVFETSVNPLAYINEAQSVDLLPLAKAELGVPAEKVAPTQLQ